MMSKHNLWSRYAIHAMKICPDLLRCLYIHLFTISQGSLEFCMHLLTHISVWHSTRFRFHPPSNNHTRNRPIARRRMTTRRCATAAVCSLHRTLRAAVMNLSLRLISGEEFTSTPHVALGLARTVYVQSYMKQIETELWTECKSISIHVND